MKYWNHLKIITIHKYYVLIECFKRGLYWQGLVHDLSKYSFIEFFNSAKYFQGDKTPIAIEKIEKGYSLAWQNHKGKNKHHWEYWIDFVDGELKMIPIPKKYIEEMACDMVGASKAYLKCKYNPDEPLEYFKKNSKNWYIEKESKNYLKQLLIEIRFFDIC
jgi:hypothetical protein